MSRLSGIYVKETNDPSNMAANDAEAAASSFEVDVTVPGAEIGDFVFVAPPYTLTGKVLYSAYVSAAGTVKIVGLNCAASPNNLASGDWVVKTVRPEIL